MREGAYKAEEVREREASSYLEQFVLRLSYRRVGSLHMTQRKKANIRIARMIRNGNTSRNGFGIIA